MKRNVEIDDSLEERVVTAKDELTDDILEFMKENPEWEDWDEWYDGAHYGCDRMHEIVDSNTPIYYSDIDGIYYLWGDELEEAYKNMGLGDGGEDNHRQVAIYSYIDQELNNYLCEIQEVFNERQDQAEEGKALDDFKAFLTEEKKKLDEEYKRLTEGK